MLLLTVPFRESLNLKHCLDLFQTSMYGTGGGIGKLRYWYTTVGFLSLNFKLENLNFKLELQA